MPQFEASTGPPAQERVEHLPRSALFALLFAMFTVAVGYGFVLPVLPFLVGELVGTADSAPIARHTGLLTGIYVAALFLFPPFWRRVSDRWGRRRVIVFGLAGLGSSLALFALFDDIYLLYIGRFLDGFFASSVTPVALAAINSRAPTSAWRAQHLEWLSIAAIAGFLVGPMLGGFVAGGAALIGVERAFEMPFLATATIAYAAAIVAGWHLGGVGSGGRDAIPGPRWADAAAPLAQATVVARLLLVSLTVGAGLGAFEVTLAVRGTQVLGMTPFQVGLMFFECSAVMVIVQAVVFSPLVKPHATRWLFAPVLGVTAVALLALPWASGFTVLLILVSAIAASLGLLYPLTTYWMSLTAGEVQAKQLGRHAATVSFGQALGSASVGLLFGATFLPEASVLVAIALLVVMAVSLKLPHLLAPLAAWSDRSAADGRSRHFPIEATDVEKGRKSHGPL